MKQPDPHMQSLTAGDQHDSRLSLPNNSVHGTPPDTTRKSGDYEPKTYEGHGVPREHQWKPVAGYSYLPTQPITLSKDQEIFLLRKLAADVSGCTLDQVKNVYQEMATRDNQLTGWGSYTELGVALQKHGVGATFATTLSMNRSHYLDQHL